MIAGGRRCLCVRILVFPRERPLLHSAQGEGRATMRFVIAGNLLQIRAMRKKGTAQGRPRPALGTETDRDDDADADALHARPLGSRGRNANGAAIRPGPSGACRPHRSGRDDMEQPMRGLRHAGITALQLVPTKLGLHRPLAGLSGMRGAVRTHHLHGMQHVHAAPARYGCPALWTMHQRRSARRYLAAYRNGLQGWRREELGSRYRTNHCGFAEPCIGRTRHRADIRARQREGAPTARVRPYAGSRNASGPYNRHAARLPVREAPRS